MKIHERKIIDLIKNNQKELSVSKIAEHMLIVGDLVKQSLKKLI